MTAPKFSTYIAASLLLTAWGALSHAQETPIYVDNTDHDLQFFSPVDFDFENRPIGPSCGYFFNYDKLNWAYTGERTNIGVEGGTNNGSTNPFRLFESGEALDEDDLILIPIPGNEIYIPAPLVPTSITNSAPRANFAWGDRYEFGYFNDTHGFTIGILDGIEAVDRDVYGFGFTGQDDTVVGGVGLPTNIPNNPFNQLLSPFGSVHVAFEVPIISAVPNFFGEPITLMHGFLDVQEGISGGVPGSVLTTDDNGDGVLDGDGFADDIDRDGHYGPDGFDLETPAEVPDSFQVGGTEPDYDDLVELPTSFQSVNVRNLTEMNGVELMHTYRLSNRHRMAKHQNNYVEWSYGVRYLKLDDHFLVDGFGGTIGQSFWDTRIQNNLVGPQIALKWMRQERRVRWDLGARCLFGYNIQNWEQEAGIAEDARPGALNRPIYLQPTYSTYGKQVNDFSPLVEMRLQASYQLTGALAAKLGYSATFIDNIARASQQVRYRLPEMGFREDGGTQEIFINGVNFGFEVVY